MGAVRNRLYGIAWFSYLCLFAGMMVVRHRLPEQLPSRYGVDGQILSWTGRDAFLLAHFLVPALVLVFVYLIDRVFTKKIGCDNAFLAAVTLVLTCAFCAALLPVFALAFGVSFKAYVWIGVAAAIIALFWAGYRARKVTLVSGDQPVMEVSAYFRVLKPGGLMSVIPFTYPFFPYSISLNRSGLLLRGVLLEGLWKWERIVSIAPGKASQAYAGNAVRIACSGKDVVVVTLNDLKWPLVTNAPDRDTFFRTVRELAPHVSVG